MIMPASLITYLRRCKDFAAEDEVTQRRLACMLWMALQPRRQHRRYPGMSSFSKGDIRRIWGSDATMRRVLKGKHFLVLEGDNLVGYTAAFQPSHEMLNAAQACLEDPEPDDFVDDEGVRLRRFPYAIDPRRAGSLTRSAWPHIAPANRVDVDMDGLLALRPHAEPLERQSIDLLMRVARNRLAPGAVPVRYVQHSTGRLFMDAKLPISLQGVPRLVRVAALAGCWDYDIANCHFAILSGLAKRIGLASPEIDHYLACKAEVRSAIANEVGVEVEQAKACLLMIMYGARRTRWKNAAIVKEIKEPAARRLFKCTAFLAIHDEVERLRPPVIADHTRRAGWVTNPLDLRISAAEPERRVLAHLLQGYEALALREVVKLHGERILLCMHDGWVSREKLDLHQCEAAIRRVTGLPLSIEEVRLVSPVVDGRLRTEFAAPEDEKIVEDQGLADVEVFSYATKSPLQGRPLTTLKKTKPAIFLSGVRPAWNYAPD